MFRDDLGEKDDWVSVLDAFAFLVSPPPSSCRRFKRLSLGYGHMSHLPTRKACSTTHAKSRIPQLTDSLDLIVGRRLLPTNIHLTS